ncbi:MAG: SAM-dependent methyltransferase [Clostridia bacterium]|jgi:SAM-dependent methyltransferase|nr:SAM-dependent methyltransferase [Clostridia bacterium]
MTPYELLAQLIARSLAEGVMKKAVFSKPQDKSVRRAVLTPRTLGGKRVAQLEIFFADNKAGHENLSPDDEGRFSAFAMGFGQVNLLTTAGEAELRVSKGGKCTLIGGDRLRRAIEKGGAPLAEVQGNDRKKERILQGDEPFLRLLDVSDATGRVHDKKQSKFRQINRFLELIRDCLSALPKEGELRICDLCCGKSYLSFAVYHYFTRVLGRRVRMTGVDLKPDVIAYCNEVANKLGFDGLEFLCGDVGRYDAGEHVHMVISLHACDTATDLVLGRAMDWGADVILSTPCCHHELNHTLNCAPLAFIAEHSMLRQKLCDAATDALRLKLLASKGYAVCALELIDPEETPKNIMLRALRRPHFDPASPEAEALRAEYAAARAFLLGG